MKEYSDQEREQDGDDGNKGEDEGAEGAPFPREGRWR